MRSLILREWRGAYGNEIYESLEIRAVLHMHNRLVGSWHIERQELLEQMVECAPGERIVDVGFGVPGRYVESALRRPKPERPTIRLLDKCQSAQLFSEALLRVWFGRVPDEVAFSTFDLDDVAEVPKGDKYVMFDVIEHAREPDRAMSRVAAYVFLLATAYFFWLLGIHFVLGWLLVWVLLCIPFIRWRLVIRWVTSQAKLTWQYRPGTRE